VDRDLYIPRSWKCNPDRCRAAGLSENTVFATKPELAARMISRFLDTGHRVSWVARGTPQGSVISPVPANLYLRYAFDGWLTRNFPNVTFERYCDDAVIRCKSERQVRRVRDALSERLAQVGLELHPDKTRIVYCKDADRRLVRAHVVHVPRVHVPSTAGQKPVREALRELPARGQQGGDQGNGQEIRSWRIACRSECVVAKGVPVR
jgi:hypothetical protein